MNSSSLSQPGSHLDVGGGKARVRQRLDHRPGRGERAVAEGGVGLDKLEHEVAGQRLVLRWRQRGGRERRGLGGRGAASARAVIIVWLERPIDWNLACIQFLLVANY